MGRKLLQLSHILLIQLAIFAVVEGRSVAKRDVVDTTTEINEEITTTIQPETSTTVSNNGITFDISRFTSPANRSLYDELKAATSSPMFSSELLTDSEMSEKLLLNESGEEEEKRGKSEDVSMESMFKENENDFKNNVTKEERHTIDEVLIDGQMIKYSSLNKSRVKVEDENEETTTVIPLVKKGKYLELMPPGEDNMNTSIPNAAEVWALAAMREVDTRKPNLEEDVELLNENMNNTVKSLLDWTEIAKLDNETTLEATTKAAVTNVDDEDPVTAENKEIVVPSLAPLPESSTPKSTIEDNRVELEHKNVELAGANESLSKSEEKIARIDTEIFAKSDEDDDLVELIAPVGKSGEKENLVREATTTESSEQLSTTESPEEEEVATTIESDEVTTSIIDTFTAKDDPNEDSDVFKRTITEMPEVSTTVSTPEAETTVVMITITTERPNPSLNEIPESTMKYNKSTMVTKSISIRIAASTTTEQPETTTEINEETSTQAPTFMSHSQQSTEFPPHEDYDTIVSSASSTSISPIEITDDDKFKYNTLLPETTASVDSSRAIKTGKKVEEDVVVTHAPDALNKETAEGEDGSSTVVIVSVTVSLLVLAILAIGGFLLLKNRKKKLTYGQRCRPVGLDAYSLDNVSVFNSVRRKANALRLSKRSYGNSAFEDPSLQSNVLDYQSLQDFTKNKTSIYSEFKEIPQITVRVEEVPENCEDKNRYANVVPLPETRVHLQRLNDDEKTEYINANYVKGPKDNTNYYIATQAPLENTVADFWRMIWEQNSKVIVMVTDLTENGVERCAEYIPASIVVDNTITYGDYQVTLKSREVKGKYAVSQVHLKNLKTNTWREIMHLWYSWPENGCPTDESSVISMLLEARGYLRTSLPEHLDENSNTESNNNEKVSTLDKTKSLQRVQGPLTVHCSPGTGRTGTIIACDIVLRMLETPPRQIDIPQIVYHVRRGRANAVRTKDQYEFIYSIANSYATKLNTVPAET